MAKSYRADCALVVAHTPRGDAYIYDGGFLPEDTDPEQLAQLIDTGLVVEFVPLAADDGPFDPEAHNVAEVNAHLASASEDEQARVLAAEAAGSNRKGIVGDGA